MGVDPDVESKCLTQEYRFRRQCKWKDDPDDEDLFTRSSAAKDVRKATKADANTDEAQAIIDDILARASAGGDSRAAAREAKLRAFCRESKKGIDRLLSKLPQQASTVPGSPEPELPLRPTRHTTTELTDAEISAAVESLSKNPEPTPPRCGRSRLGTSLWRHGACGRSAVADKFCPER